MNISKIASIELDRTKPFKHYIKFKDKDGWIIEQQKVPDSKSDAIYKEVIKAWMSHPDFNPKVKQ